MSEHVHVWLHISEGTEITAYAFDSLEDAGEFRRIYADDEIHADGELGLCRCGGSYKDIDDIPQLPEWGERDNHETDTWVLLAGQVEAVDGIGPVPLMRRRGALFAEVPQTG